MRVLGLTMLLCLCAGPAMARSGHASGEGQSGSDQWVTQGQNSPRPDWLDVSVVSGVEQRVDASWNCDRPDAAPFIMMLEFPAHGSVEIREVPSGSPCDGPMRGVFYTSQPGYTGSDRIGYRIYSGARSYASFTKDIVVK
jgi:hypothetical protein